MGARRTTSAIFVIVAALFMTLASSAAAHGDEVHAGHPPAAGATGGGATPGAIPAVNEPVTGGGAAGGTPAPGAQPAAPTNALPPVANGAVGNTGAATPAVAGAGTAPKPAVNVIEAAAPKASDTSGSSTTTTTSTPKLGLETISEPVTAPAPKTASGGGGSMDVTDAGPTAVPSGASVVVGGGGDLPFTGIEETILLIALSGMLVPIGVLLYCGARRGDRMRYLRQLAAPRFQWAPAPGVRPDANGWPDARA